MTTHTRRYARGILLSRRHADIRTSSPRQVDSLLQQLPSASHVTFGFHSDDMTQVATPRVRSPIFWPIDSQSAQFVSELRNHFEHMIALYFG